MAALHGGGNTSVAGDGEAPPPATVCRRGGWITAPFIIATVAGLSLATGGWQANLIVYLIQEFNIKRINAAQINNFVIGCSNFFPIIGAIVADSFLGCFSVIWISSLISLLGLILLMLTVTLDVLRPPNCETASSLCATPSGAQYSVLFAALALGSIGKGGTRFTLATLGASQFSKLKHQSSYFNWYIFTLCVSGIISSTAIVYVEDNFSWGWGFGICIAANVLGLVVFLFGSRYYYCDKPQGSPLTSLLRVVVASVGKRKAVISSKSEDYYYGDDHGRMAEAPTKSFRFLNRAALKTEGDIQTNGSSITKPWKLCSVQQVEDLKTLLRILPLWSTGILLFTPIGVQLSLTVLQALTTDRHLARSFKVPAGSMIVFALISTAISLSLFDHSLWPLWKKIFGTNNNPTPMQRIGIGHVFNIAMLAVSALVESKRRSHIVPVSVLWLVPQMVIGGVGEAFHFPGQVALFYQEFPISLKSMSTAMIALQLAVAFYLSTAVIDFVRRVIDIGCLIILMIGDWIMFIGCLWLLGF